MRDPALAAKVLAISALLVLGTVMITTATSSHGETALAVGVEVADYELENESVVGATVALQNYGAEQTVVARVWGKRDHRQHLWANATGAKHHTLARGERRVVKLQRGKFALNVAPSQPIMVTITTPDGRQRNATVFTPRGGYG